MAVAQSYARGGSAQRNPIEMVVTVPAETLRARAPVTDPGSDGSGLRGHDRGASIPVAIVEGTDVYLEPEVTRRLACDCGVVAATVDERGEPLSVGRKRRTIPAAIKRALLLRDRTCRFPGCDHRLFLDGHHLQHWADGGETKLSNLVLVCGVHHAHVHERGYRIVRDGDGTLVFLDPRGVRVVAVPPRPVPSQLGWPAIRAANAEHRAVPLSAATAHVSPDGGKLDCEEAIIRLFAVKQQADGSARAPIFKRRQQAGAKPDRGASAPSSGKPHRYDEGTADSSYDFAAAGHRVDDLLAWSMEVLLATGEDPMAQVPAPIWPPPDWRRPG